MTGRTSLVGLLPALIASLPRMLEDVSRALAAVDPAYADFLEGGRAQAVGPAELAVRRLVWGAEQALRSHPEVGDRGRTVPPGRPEPGDEQVWGLFAELGREQRRRGRPVQALLSAYQAGGRAAWRHLAAEAVRCGVRAEALAALAEEVFALVDRLGAVTVEGYVDERDGGEDRLRLRGLLAERLLSDRADRAAVAAAARAADWPLPATAAVLYLTGGEDADRTALSRLGTDSLELRHTRLPGAVVPEPAAPGRRQRLVAALCGAPALVGPAVPLDRLPESARLAESAAGVLPAGDGPVFVEDHLDALVVHADPGLLGALRERVLRPLDAAAPGSREPLRQTLRAWLAHMGDRRAVAEELGIHPQTVRYRMRRLHELLGPALESPEGRRQLTLAVAWDPPEGAATGPARPASLHRLPGVAGVRGADLPDVRAAERG
ncbi:PucR family transcriptional regulator [Geodermatophilus sp. SYSU D00758]